ncbi:MAG: helix-turn-helix transcriptional regulator [Chloroflexi bacterium]|nr:helix-turn-helix transcriptional regulator [Chloroflexota bacterium]
MSTRERPVDRGTRRGRRLIVEYGRELRDGRLETGLSQKELGRGAATSQSSVSRIERSAVRSLEIVLAARLMAVIGRDLSMRSFPAGPPIRDAAHQALLGRFRARVSPTFRCRFEVPLSIPGDPRAFDMTLDKPNLLIGVEAETRFHDRQSLDRRLALKRRDGQIDRLILLVSATKGNRTFLNEEGAGLREAFPLRTRAILEALARVADQAAPAADSRRARRSLGRVGGLLDPWLVRDRLDLLIGLLCSPSVA